MRENERVGSYLANSLSIRERWLTRTVPLAPCWTSLERSSDIGMFMMNK